MYLRGVCVRCVLHIMNMSEFKKISERPKRPDLTAILYNSSNLIGKIFPFALFKVQVTATLGTVVAIV